MSRRVMLPHVYSRPVLGLLVVAALVYAAIWFVSRNKLIFTDEVVFAEDFARVAAGNWPATVIPHPPLYILLEGWAVRTLGYTLPAFRLVGGLSFVFTLWLLPAVVQHLLPDTSSADVVQQAALIVVSIWAVHPLALQGSLLLDIDNTVFTPAMLLFMLALAQRTNTFWKHVSLIALAFAFMLWSKLLPGSLFITATALLVAVCTRRLRAVLMGLGLGALLFAATLALFATFTGFSLTTFLLTFNRVAAPTTGGSSLLVSRGLMGGGITALWVGLPFLALFGAAVAHRVIAIVRNLRSRSTSLWVAIPAQVTWRDLLWLCALPAYIILSVGNDLPMGFPRYHYPFVLLMVLMTGLWLAERKLKLDARFIGAAVVCAAYLAVVAPDPLLPQYRLTFDTNSLAERLRFGITSQMVALGVPFLALLLFFGFSRRALRSALLQACLAFVVAAWPVMTLAQARASYATIYEYGREGGRETAAWVQQHTQVQDVVVAPKEIHFAANRQGEFIVQLVGPKTDAEAWLTYFQTHQPAAYVLTTKEDGRYTQVTRDARVQALLDACYAERIRVGNYIAYARTITHTNARCM